MHFVFALIYLCTSKFKMSCATCVCSYTYRIFSGVDQGMLTKWVENELAKLTCYGFT